jgi:hypothetical protein
MQFNPLDAAEKVAGKADKEAQMFEPKASFCASRLGVHFFGNPRRGQRLGGAFFGLLFLARQEK